MGKHSEIYSSTKWRLGENVVLQKSSVTLTVVGLNDSRAVYTASSEFCEPKRLVRCWKKVERKYVQEQPIQFHCYSQNMGFVNRMDQNMAKYRIGIQMKNWWWSPFVWVINVVPQGALVLHRINKDEGDESLSSCFSKASCQCNFSEIFKRRQIILEPCRNSKYPIRCLLWWHTTFSGRIWTQAYSEPL